MRVTRVGDNLVVVPSPGASLGRDLAVVRALPHRRFRAADGAWVAPATRETWDALTRAGVDLRGLTPPSASAYHVSLVERAGRPLLAVVTPGDPASKELCRRLPDHHLWDGARGAWLVRPSGANVEHLLNAFPTADWSDAAAAVAERQAADRARAGERAAVKRAMRDAPPDVDDYRFKTTPYAHQRVAFMLSRDEPAFALLMEQRTGKTKVVIDTAAYLHAAGRLDGVLVVCPNTVKAVWADDQIPAHLPDYVARAVTTYEPALLDRRRDRATVDRLATPGDGTTLEWLVMNVEALGSSPRAVRLAERFLRARRCMMVIDESTRIKTPGAKQTRAATRLGRLARYRRILTGTPSTQGPLDLYAQYRFLDPEILGFGSYYAFRNRYAVMGGYQGYQVVAYANLEELQARIDPYSYRVTRAECFDLPPKQYVKRVVELTPAQRRAYDDLRREMLAEIDGRQVGVSMALTRVLRLQQIVGGFVPAQLYHEDEGTWDPPELTAVPGGSAKLPALLELLEEETARKVVVWARFRPEIADICRALRERYGAGSVAEIHGDVRLRDRAAAVAAMQDRDGPTRFLVAQQDTARYGIDLSAADLVVYYSNTFSLETRLQTEDRTEHPSRTTSTTYVDLVARRTVDDQLIIKALRTKRSLADLITGDARWTEWL